MKVFIWFLFFLPIVYAAENYDYFQFVQQWPPVVCGDTKNCNLPDPMNFTIHGLWPSDSCKPGEPLNCPGSKFDPSKIKDLIPELNKWWPNITGENMCFWENQWNSHGTCSEERFDEHGYFSKALDLEINVDDILGYLNKSEINPLPKVLYRSSDIIKAIEKETGRKPRLWCKYNKHLKITELLEISVCYDLALAHIDCPPQLLNYPENKCDPAVGYPPYPSNSADSTDNRIDKKEEL